MKFTEKQIKIEKLINGIELLNREMEEIAKTHGYDSDEYEMLENEENELQEELAKLEE